MFGKEFLYIIKSIKKTKFYILKILIEIGNVRKRTLINQKRYKKDYIFPILKILIENWECLGKSPYIS
jgi:uncharacterized Fe-S cluster-containing MiaB family protein